MSGWQEPTCGRGEPPRALRVLVADDDALNRRLVEASLRSLGHVVHQARTGLEALDALEAVQVDLVLMDLHMPELDGMDTTRALREREGRGRRTPVLALTARPEEPALLRAAGMDGQLQKPLEPHALVQALAFAAEPPRPVEAPRVGEPPVDVALLHAQTAGDRGLLEELVTLFERDTPRLMGLLEGAVTRGDALALRETAHRLGGALLTLAARPAAAQARTLEQLGRDARLEEAAPALASLRVEVARLSLALARLSSSAGRLPAHGEARAGRGV